MGAVESKASIAPRARAISCTMYGHKNSHHLIAMNPLKYTNEGRQTHGSQNLSLKKSRRRENKGGREGISRPHWPRYQQSTVNSQQTFQHESSVCNKANGTACPDRVRSFQCKAASAHCTIARTTGNAMALPARSIMSASEGCHCYAKGMVSMRAAKICKKGWTGKPCMSKASRPRTRRFCASHQRTILGSTVLMTCLLESCLQVFEIPRTID